MSLKNALISATLALSLVVLCAGAALAFRNVSEGQQAPGFTLKDTEGKDVSLSDAAGKVAVVVFFRPDQKNSLDALAALQKLSERYAAKGVVVLAIMSEAQQQNDVGAVISQEKITFPVLLDLDRKVYGDWGAFLYPTTGIIGKDGKLLVQIPSYDRNYSDAVEGNVRVALGEITKEQLDALLHPKGKEALTPEQKKAERHMMLAERLIERKLLDKAAAELAEAVQADPNLAEAKVQYGFVLLKTGDAAHARENFEGALKINPKMDDAKTGLGAAMVALGDADKGIEMLTDALKLNPRPARAHFELGKAYEKKGDSAKAAEHYRKAVELLGGDAW